MKLCKFYVIFSSLILFGACSPPPPAASEIVVPAFIYPDTIIKCKLQEEFDNACWMYFAGMNNFGYSCYNTKTKITYNYSVVENDPKLLGFEQFGDTTSLFISDNFPRDSSCFCMPIGIFSANRKAYYISFWFEKGNSNVIYRHQGLPINYRKGPIHPQTVLFNLSDSLKGIDIKEGRQRGTFPIDEQEKRLIDSIKANRNKLRPWFIHICDKKNLFK